jgi:hypothetical protein
MNEKGSATVAAPAAEPALAETASEPDAMPQSIGGAYLAMGVEPTGRTPEETEPAESPRPPNAANLVMGILLDYRAYDTLGEATVIFTAVIGAYAVLRHVGRRRHAGNEPDR